MRKNDKNFSPKYSSYMYIDWSEKPTFLEKCYKSAIDEEQRKKRRLKKKDRNYKKNAIYM